MRAGPALVLGLTLALSTPSTPMAVAQPAPPSATPGVIANNAFFYYADLDAATRFYTKVIGAPVVADYGYARILRLASTSYLTLVDAAKGMHAADEPKTTALALVTTQLDQWHAHMTARGATLRAPYAPAPGRPHDGFVVVDPEGYFLEFERFNPHPENMELLPVLQGATAIPMTPEGRPDNQPALGFSATVLWLYYKDLAAAQRFYENRLGFAMIADQGWTKIYRTSGSGFVGLVDQARGMHKATEKKGVTASFLTRDVDAWYRRVVETKAFELRPGGLKQDEQGRYRAFVGYDVEGYYLEFDTFLEHAVNASLMPLLR